MAKGQQPIATGLRRKSSDPWDKEEYCILIKGLVIQKTKDGISVELFQIPKDDAVKVLHSMCQQIGKTQQWPQDWKRSVFIQSQRKAMPKNAQTTAQLHSSHMLAK